jgi:hypothetical protein
MAQVISFGVLGYFVGIGLALNILGLREMRNISDHRF